MKIFCLTVSYNARINLEQISFGKQNGFLPVVFDNSSNADIRESNRLFCSANDIFYETFNSNVGLPKAYNHVIKKYLQGEDWLVILDQDTCVTEEYFKKVKEACESNSSLAYFAIFKYGKDRYGPKVIYNYKKDKVLKNNKPIHQKGFLIGINSCSVFSKRVFDAIGFYNEDLFLDYVDNDICFKMAKHEIQSETIDVVIEQKFFSKEKNEFSKVKRRFQNQKKDAKTFYSSSYFSKPFLMLIHYQKEMIKFAILYSLHNSIFWFFPLLLSKARSLKS